MRRGNVEVYDGRNPTNGHPGWWAARCLDCRRVIVKYAFTTEDAFLEAAAEPCECATAVSG